MLWHHQRTSRYALAGAVVLVAALAGCSSRTKAVPVIGAKITPVTVAQLTNSVASLYAKHPDVASFTSQKVEYAPTTRDKVLRICSQGGQASDAQTQESNQVLACGPLIYFFYSYAQQRGVTESFDVADQLYSYAATGIHGPFNAASTLGSLLRGWGVPVAPTATSTSSAGTAATPEDTLISSAKAAILGQAGAHVVVRESTTSPKTSATVVADVGTTSASQTLTSATAKAALRLTLTAAYLSGNSAGLASFYGISPKNIAKVGTRWIAINKGSAEYANFVAENTISALPASTLPSNESTAVTTNTVNGALVYVLTWTTTADGTTTAVDFTLELAATGEPLPITETSSGGGTTETTTFSDWGRPVTVTVPKETIPFTSLASR